MMLLSSLVLVLASLPLPPVEPPPSWVKPLEVPKVPEKTSGAFHTLLRDTQVRVGDTIETFERRVFKVLNQPGVEAIASQKFSWNPASETLALHGVWVWRNGKRRDAWHPDDARVLPQEDDLAANLYDGRQKLVLELRDVRPGDIVEYAFTRRGENPVFQNHVTLWAEQASESAISKLHYELTWLREGTLEVFTRGGAKPPDIDGTVYSWTLNDVKAVDWEDHAPEDVDQIPYVIFSNWHDWSTVRAWAETLFEQPAAGEAFDELVTRLRELPEDQRAREAVRVVQDEIRYVGVELGQHSHQPHSPSWVLERGFGDCKDKTLLLVSLLRAVGLEAWPALVNTDAAPGFINEPASSSNFNHAVALVKLPSGPMFIDGTSTLNRGALENREPLPYRYALVIRPGETALTAIEHPLSLAPTWDVTQKWNSHVDGSAELTLVTVARGHEAPALRRTIERRTREDLERSWRERRVRDFDTDLTMMGLEWVDDTEAETFTLTERYLVGRFYKNGDEHRFETIAIDGDLTFLPDSPRTQPWQVNAPLHAHERIEWTNFTPLEESHFQFINETIESSVFKFRTTQEVRDGKLILEWSLKNMSPRLEPEHFDAHREATRRAAEMTRYAVKSPSNSEPGAPVSKRWKQVIGISVGLLLTVLFLALTTPLGERLQHARRSFRSWRAARASARQVRPGQRPDDAVRVTSMNEAMRLFRAPRCPLGHEWRDVERSNRDGITTLTRRCSTCVAEDVRYVKLLS